MEKKPLVSILFVFTRGLILLAALLLSGCLLLLDYFPSRWTEEERQKFKVACEEQETIPQEIQAEFVGFDREEIRSVNVEHIRDGEIIETFVVSPVFLKNNGGYRIIYGAEITGRTIQPRDTLRFTVGQQVFTLSDFKMMVQERFTMVSEGYGCELGEVAVNGEKKEYDRRFVKPGYQDTHQEKMFSLSPDSDEYRLLVVGQIILYIDTFRAEVAEKDDDWYEWYEQWDGLRILGYHYVTPDTVDDTGLKLAEAKRLKEQWQIKWKNRDFLSAVRDKKAADLISLEVLKTRYVMFQEKIAKQSGDKQ